MTQKLHPANKNPLVGKATNNSLGHSKVAGGRTSRDKHHSRASPKETIAEEGTNTDKLSMYDKQKLRQREEAFDKLKIALRFVQ